MKAYRTIIKGHFEGIPGWRRLLDFAFVFWGLGLLLYILGGSLAFAFAAASGILSGVGYWLLAFGLAVAFIKKDDWGLMITTAGAALFNLIMFIIFIARTGVLDFGTLFDALGFSALCGLSCASSEAVKTAGIRRAQKAALLARTAESGTACGVCGAAMMRDTLFCNSCGAKRPEKEYCASCGSELKDGAQFCNKCGAPAAEKAKCSSCGQPISAADEFCSGCGASAKAPEPSQTI